MATKGGGKGRGRSGGLRFTEEELAEMKSRVRGVNVVSSTANGLERAIAKKIQEENMRTTVFTPTKPKSTDWTAPLSTKSKNLKVEKSEAPKDNEDPDWTASRTTKVKSSGKKTINVHIKDVNESIRQSQILTSASENHLSIVFEGARLLTLNEILSVLPYQPYLIYNYKTTWKNKVEEALLVAKSNHKILPEFSDACIFVGMRRSTRLVDRDGLASCFKYILDDLRNQLAVNEKILKDDNPNLIVDTPCFQTQGTHLVGFRLERVSNWHEPSLSTENLLSMGEISSGLWAGRSKD